MSERRNSLPARALEAATMAEASGYKVAIIGAAAARLRATVSVISIPGRLPMKVV